MAAPGRGMSRGRGLSDPERRAGYSVVSTRNPRRRTPAEWSVSAGAHQEPRGATEEPSHQEFNVAGSHSGRNS